MEAVMFPDALVEAIVYLRRLDYEPTLENRQVADGGLHVKLTDPGGSRVSDYVLEEHALIVDVSHPDSEVASLHARRLAAILRSWPMQSPKIYAEPSKACSAPVWNPLVEPRVPAYTLTVLFSLGGETVEV